MIDKQYLASRVLNANDGELVAILYEGLLDTIEDAKNAIENNNDILLNNSVYKSREILAELLETVVGESQIAFNLRSLYIYLNKLMTNAKLNKDVHKFNDAAKVITPLYEAWCELGKNMKSGAIPQGPAVVAGLTYGKGSLNNHVVNDNERWKMG